MYEFTQDCMTGIQEIDEEHAQLFAIINETMELLHNPAGDTPVEAARNLVMMLKGYAITHFEHEEAYMRRINDPELVRQLREHMAFREKIEKIDLSRLDEESGKAVLEDLLEYLARWLYRHILGSDILIGKLGNLKEETDPFAFTEEYLVGVELIDEEHKQLFKIIGEANELVHAELLHDKYDEIMRIIANLKEYTIRHFQDEEDYMESIGYEGLEAQKNAHQAFVDKLNEIDLEEVDNNQQEYLEELVQFLLGWLVNHILMVDKRIPVNRKES